MRNPEKLQICSVLAPNGCHREISNVILLKVALLTLALFTILGGSQILAHQNGISLVTLLCYNNSFIRFVLLFVLYQEHVCIMHSYW